MIVTTHDFGPMNPFYVRSMLRNQRLMSPGQAEFCQNSPYLAWLVPIKRGNIAKKLRQAVIERDGLLCSYCSEFIPVGKIAIDHVLPVTKGGEDHEDNFVVSCKSCNSKKGSKTLLQWFMERAGI